MYRLELAIFDMAGTVVDEDNVVYKTLRKAINKNGFDLGLKFVLEHGAGKEKHQAIKDIMKASGKNAKGVSSDAIFKDFKEELEHAYQNLKVVPFGGVLPLFAHLRKNKIKIALNTGYDTNTAQLLLHKMGWSAASQYDVLVTADDVQRGRPFPDMIWKAMDFLNIEVPQFVMKAGDSIIDIEEGKNAHCGLTVGVTTGAHTKSQLISALPTLVVRSLAELQPLIKGPV